MLVDGIDGGKLKLKRVVEVVQDEVIVRRSFGKMNVLNEDHLNCQAKNKSENADFQIGKFHDFDSSNYDTDADDIVNDPVLVGKVVSEGNPNCYKKTDNVKNSDFEEILNLDSFFEEVKLEKEDDLIGADPDTCDASDEYKSLKDGPSNIGRFSNNTKHRGSNPKYNNHPIINLDPSPSHGPGFRVYNSQNDKGETKDHNDNKPPLKSVGGKLLIAKDIIGERRRESLDLKFKDREIVELADLGRAVVPDCNVAGLCIGAGAGRKRGRELVLVDAFEGELESRSHIRELNDIRGIGEILPTGLSIGIKVTQGAVERLTLLNKVSIVLVGRKHPHSHVIGS